MASPVIGRTLGQYRILEEIGSGGMCVVYRARDERLERDVALKILPQGLLAGEVARRGFRREALALSKLTHPHVTTDGWLKVLDFGLAKSLLLESETTTDTAGERLAGTPPYMAPEQLRGEPADHRSDIYTAGMVLYEMAAGQRPFPDAHGARLISAILHDSPPPPSAS